ncbi:36707_t:CDS:2, partial [Racocetra persica]
MTVFGILKHLVPFFLNRRIPILPSNPKRRITTILFFNKKVPVLQKKASIVLTYRTFQRRKCHPKDSHEIEEVNMSEILASGNGRMVGIKFHWHLTCRCGHQFSSSLCNADLKVKTKKIVLVRKYHLQCLKCDQSARFDREKLLTKFLKERVKQRLIYSFYREEFAQFAGERSGRMLKGHRQDLCEK